jgi:type I restriction enzyme R subunit
MSESEIEQEFIQKLDDLKYIYRQDIRDRTALHNNFRKHFEALNKVNLTDAEFARLLDDIITPDVFAAARKLRERNSFERGDGTELIYMLVNISDWCKNTFEVVNQVRINTDNSHHRYDVMLLMNGLPVAQIELKNLQISPRLAMKQIVDYKNDPGNGYTKTLLCFLQLFIVSNRTDTYYFANNNEHHFSFDADERFLPIYQFASVDNRKITHLYQFADTFLAKCALSEMVSRYMVLVASEQKLMMMRPYQIYAVRAIVDCIQQNSGNGYIWHTTGSGKTLTSFKASTLLKDNPAIEKCLFVVDRKDLDRQTREEFNKFQKDCVEENTNTESLVRRLISTDYADKVIVTTIQKLGLALDGTSKQKYKQRLEPLRKKRIVFIFDECHRSQFGENHKAIEEFFPNAQLFGFTGTPIFEQNASYQQIEGQVASLLTTKDVFQQELHAYTIQHAIEDKNVLRFQIDYYEPKEASKTDAASELEKTDKKAGANKNTKPVKSATASKIEPDGVAQKKMVVDTILEKHDTATSGRKFNAILATSSINDAIEYHRLFKTVQESRLAENSEFKPLNIACVFSPPADSDKDVQQIQEDLPQEKVDNSVDPETKKIALKTIIADYNARFGTNHSINEFDLYYQDIQKRIKDQQYPNKDLPHTQKIDVIIVVDMLLTGFDSKFLNTLYVDKNLKHHGLIQAFSRTNRILNESKPFGKILDFRQQRSAVDAAIELFSGEKTQKVKEIWLVEKAPVVIEKLEAAYVKLDDFMTSQGLKCAPEDVANLKGDAARTQFIHVFKEVQRLKTQLDQYTDLTPEETTIIENILPPEAHQGFRGVYLDVARRLKNLPLIDGKSPENTEQLDFEFVLFASAVIDYDYIMALISRFSNQSPGKMELSRAELIGLIQADAKFLDERDDIAAYIETLEIGKGLDEAAIKNGYAKFKKELDKQEMTALAELHGLEPEELQRFVDFILRRMIFDGESLTALFAPLNLGWKNRTQREKSLMQGLIPLLHKRAQGREISGLGAYEQ